MARQGNGRVVKERDDLMSATRYACMMLRHAELLGRYGRIDNIGPRIRHGRGPSLWLAW
jgi:hypothetical protein